MKFLDNFLDMWGGVVLRQECCILLLSCRGKSKHPQFAAWGGTACVCYSVRVCCPLLSQQSCRGFKSSWKICGREQRAKSLTTHNQEMWGSRSWWLCRGKTWVGNHEGHRVKMCRNAGFFTCPVQTVHWGSWWVQGSLAVAEGRAVTLCAQITQENLPVPEHHPPAPDMSKTLFILDLPLAHSFYCQAPQLASFRHWYSTVICALWAAHLRGTRPDQLLLPAEGARGTPTSGPSAIAFSSQTKG